MQRAKKPADSAVVALERAIATGEAWRRELAAARVPPCGVYACIVGEVCYPKDKIRRGQEKIGFSGVALAAREAVARRGSRLQFTGEGGVVGNPSWWAVKA